MIAHLIADSHLVKQREEPVCTLAESKSRTWSALDIIARGTLTREQALTVYKITEEDLALFEPRWCDLRTKRSK
jgi:hypothetical protein